MATKAYHAARIVVPEGVATDAYLVVSDGVIEAIAHECPACEVVELGDAWVVPGYVDTHIHGFADHDVMDYDAAGVNAASEELARHGTTSWLATTLTASLEQTAAACASVRDARDARQPGYLGARLAGIFLEGPFFCEKRKGAQNGKYLVDPDIEWLRTWQEAADGMIVKSALAPERAGSAEYIRSAVAEGVTCAIGHTDATYDQACAAVDAGATVFVHTYNAMSPLAHREPGVVGCAMTSPDAYAELICDGHHVHPAAVAALVRAKGWEHVVLVSDCLRCGGMPDGDYLLGELPIVLEGGVAHLRDEGNLAGSVLTLDAAVRNVVAWGVATPEQAIRMASEIPARSCGIDGSCGLLVPGRMADFNVLEPDLTLRATYVGGCMVA